MNIQLKKVTRENWEEALELKVMDSQSRFVPAVAVSLAKVYIKPDGENVTYLPFAIYDHKKMIGFVMLAYEADTSDMYWINGFLIDEQYQGYGYGKAALAKMQQWIVHTFPQCREIRLTVYGDNHVARKLYINYGFRPTGEILGEEDIFFLPVE